MVKKYFDEISGKYFDTEEDYLNYALSNYMLVEDEIDNNKVESNKRKLQNILNILVSKGYTIKDITTDDMVENHLVMHDVVYEGTKINFHYTVNLSGIDMSNNISLTSYIKCYNEGIDIMEGYKLYPLGVEMLENLITKLITTVDTASMLLTKKEYQSIDVLADNIDFIPSNRDITILMGLKYTNEKIGEDVAYMFNSNIVNKFVYDFINGEYKGKKLECVAVERKKGYIFESKKGNPKQVHEWYMSSLNDTNYVVIKKYITNNVYQNIGIPYFTLINWLKSLGFHITISV